MQNSPTVWVIGASSGIGHELARQLIQQNWRVVVSARREQRLQALAQNPACLALPLDITDPQQVSSAITKLEQELDELHSVIINTGNYQPMGLAEFDREVFEDLWRVNFQGVVTVLHFLLPFMQRQGRGEILINTSLAAYVGLPYAAPYGASKAALLNMAESLRPECLRYGIQLRVINHGFVKTDLTAKNDFAMPSLLDAETAAKNIIAALGKSSFEVTFPRGFVWWMKLLRLLPYPWFFAVSQRLLKKPCKEQSQ